MTKAAADTIQVQHPPVVILVGLDDPLAQECATAMSPIATVKAKDTGRALAQIVTLRPLVVVLRGDEPADEVADVHERAAATGARVVTVGSDRGPALRARLEATLAPLAGR